VDVATLRADGNRDEVAVYGFRLPGDDAVGDIAPLTPVRGPFNPTWEPGQLPPTASFARTCQAALEGEWTNSGDDARESYRLRVAVSAAGGPWFVGTQEGGVVYQMSCSGAVVQADVWMQRADGSWSRDAWQVGSIGGPGRINFNWQYDDGAAGSEAWTR
jgi:hypothetical protein